MSLEIPTTFKLDVDRDVTRALQQDTFATILEIEASFYRTSLYNAVDAVGELFIRDAVTVADLIKLRAFTSGAAIIVAAFYASDSSEFNRQRTFKVFGLRSVPVVPMSGNSDEAFGAFEQIANEGHCNHPEIHEAVDSLKEYNAAVTQDSLTARSAFCGAGFMIYQLDRAWDRVRAMEIDTTCQAEAGFDWDSVWEL